MKKNLERPNKLAEDWNVPLEAVQEAIAYGQSDPPEIRADKRKDEIRREARGMNDPAYKYSGRPRPLSTEERARLGL
jgi:hypothetical protein